MRERITCAFLITICILNQTLYGQTSGSALLEGEDIEGTISINGMSSIISLEDKFQANVIEGSNWGRCDVVYRVPDGQWLPINKYNTEFKVNEDGSASILDDQPGMPVVMEQRFYTTDRAIQMDVTVRAAMDFPIEIGDLAFHLPWKHPRGADQIEIFEQGFTRHHFIAGAGSFIYFTRPSGKGPFLMVLPKKGTKLEYFDSKDGRYKVYVHAVYSGNESKEGTWRQAFTSQLLNTVERPEKEIKVGLKFRWANTWDDMRDLLYEEGLFDIRIVPGMTIPTDLKATFSLHTKATIDSIAAEFPRQTHLKFLGKKKGDHYLYEVQFEKLGENKLTIHHNGIDQTILEFFATEPLDNLVKKRADFIVNNQQHRDSTKWYNGLYSVYDMKNEVLRGPDDTDGYDGWWGYVLASDDPGLCKAPYVAAKNVFYPNVDEIRSLEYYLEHYVWGKLQRSDTEEPYPYGIYGVPNWKVARDPLARAGTRSRQLDRMQIWRSYDYPHMIMLYYHLYQIAKANPNLVSYRDAAGYLDWAWQTAKAYFIYPYEIFGEYYETYKQGCYNELVIEDLIIDLANEGRQEEADWLKNEYEKKVKYFIYDDPYPYSSEYSFDRTAFESSYAFAKYGLTHQMKADSNLWFDKKYQKWMSHPEVSQTAARDFMDRQHDAGLAVRGWLEAKYFLLGSDFRTSADTHTLSYMAKMGGWSILDYGLNFADRPYDWLQLGYASYLSSWSLMNMGTAASDYGYWAPGQANDGAMGWAFTSLKHAKTWIGKDEDRGAWRYDGEADLGNGAAMRMAATILVDDPLFGIVCYGGQLQHAKGYQIHPRDGVSARFAIVSDPVRVNFEMESDGFSSLYPIKVAKDLKTIELLVENRYDHPHPTKLYIENYQGLILECFINEAKATLQKAEDGRYFIPIHLYSKDVHIAIKIK